MNLSKVKKLLIVRLSSLGDVLLSTPLIRTIKGNYPQIEVDYLVKERYKDILVQNPYLNNLYTYSGDKSGFVELIDSLKNQNYELIIDLQNNLITKKIKSFLKTSEIKFNKNNLDKLLLVRLKINRLKDAPPIPVRYASVLEEFQLDDNGLDLFSDKTSSELFKEKDKYIGFCPGSRHFTKMWPKEYYIHLGNLLAKGNYIIVLFGGKDDKKTCNEISSRISGSIDLSNNDDILQTAADMKRCDAIICNDSGLMHAACALEVPILTFFGSTVKEFGFTPYKNRNIILENNSLSCRPCTHIGKSYCPRGHFRCMLDINPENAFNKLNLLLHP